MRKARNILLFINCITIIVLLLGCSDGAIIDKERAANNIKDALYSAVTEYGGTSSSFKDVIKEGGFFKEKIKITIDFKNNWINVQRDDLVTAEKDLESILKTFQMELGNMFEKTNNLTIEITNTSELNKDNYNITENTENKIEEMKKGGGKIEINKFKQYDNKFLTIITEYGTLEIPSTFFEREN